MSHHLQYLLVCKVSKHNIIVIKIRDKIEDNKNTCFNHIQPLL